MGTLHTEDRVQARIDAERLAYIREQWNDLYEIRPWSAINRRTERILTGTTADDLHRQIWADYSEMRSNGVPRRE